MEDIKIEMKKDLDNMNNAPPLKKKKMYYNCSECPSVIEIININDEFIEFKCNNKHKIKMRIEEYLNKIKEKKDQMLLNNTVNNSRCEIHKGEEYFSYCFQCNIHLCKKCLITGEHSLHYKINIIEIIAKDDVIKEIKNLIKNNKSQIKDLKKNKTDIENKINDILDQNIRKIKDIKIKNKKKNNNNEKKELKLNNNKYKLEIEELKKKI